MVVKTIRVFFCFCECTNTNNLGPRLIRSEERKRQIFYMKSPNNTAKVRKSKNTLFNALCYLIANISKIVALCSRVRKSIWELEQKQIEFLIKFCFYEFYHWIVHKHR